MAKKKKKNQDEVETVLVESEAISDKIVEEQTASEDCDPCAKASGEPCEQIAKKIANQKTPRKLQKFL